MLSGDLLKLLRDLNRANKFYAIQVLISDLAKEEADLLNPDLLDESSSPYDDAGDVELISERGELDDEMI
jgi:hypothetical protein